MPANGAAVWAVLWRQHQAERQGGPQVEAAAECCLMRGSVSECGCNTAHRFEGCLGPSNLSQTPSQRLNSSLSFS